MDLVNTFDLKKIGNLTYDKLSKLITILLSEQKYMAQLIERHMKKRMGIKK